MTTRREFMVGAAGLTFTVLVDGCAAMRTEEPSAGASLASAPAGGAKAVNAWASLAQDGTVYIVNPAVEMGQGSQTAIPLIIADEMDADWSRVRIVPAAPDDKVYGNPGFRGLMYTAGSATVTGYWDVARAFGVGVIAETPWAAFDAKNALKVTWDRRARAFGHDSDRAIPVYSAAARDLNRAGKPWDTAGDIAPAMRNAAKIYQSEYVCDYSYHAQMEPLNSVASVSPAGDACEIWCGTQSQTMAVAAVAKALGIPVEKVKLNLTLLGGGFGRRGHRDEEFVVDSVLLSKEVKRPVKVLWTREDDVHNGRFRPLSVHFLRAGLDGSGRIVAWQHRVACDEVTAFQDPVRYKGGGEKDFLAMAGSELRTYDIPNRLAEQLPQETGIRTSSLRGIGFGPNKFATEAFLDEVAAQHGLDPVELRLQLLKNAPRGQAVIRAVVEMSDYRRKRPGRGLGFSFIDYAGTMVAAVAEVSIDKTRGKVNVHDFWLALDPGIAVQPDNVVAQTESSIVYGLGLALTERISFKDGVVQQSNLLDYGVPRIHDIPELHIKLMSTPNRPTGAGQMATPVVAPAISSAVFAASGARVRHTPFLPGRVLRAMA